VDVPYARADKILLVQDNLNTHSGGSLYELYPPQEALRILNKVEFPYTPKHGSWLNMAESEIGIMSRQCLDRRLDCQTKLANEVAAWQKKRNDLPALERELAHGHAGAGGDVQVPVVLHDPAGLLELAVDLLAGPLFGRHGGSSC
jgi:hypothetical protein